jgi:AcrR family transcriptional regulator
VLSFARQRNPVRESMEHKPKRRTRERIVETSLRLFNEFGEPNVTTTVIADEMNISPGNLYYHFRNKDEITNTIFAEFEREVDALFATPLRRAPNVEDIWLFLHLLFEAIWKYRFLYRDLNDLLSRNRIVEVHFKQLLARKVKAATALCQGLVDAGQMKALPAELASLAINMVVVATYWLSFEYVRNPRNPQEGELLARGAYQVMALAAPFLVGDARKLFEKLAQAYVEA